MVLSEILDEMRKSKDFHVKELGTDSPTFPCVHEGNVLPDDVIEFYKLCNGVLCYVDEYDEDLEEGGFPLEILPSEKVLESFKVIGGNAETDRTKEYMSSWYVIADCLDGNYITIDFAPDRLGRCYESFEYTHGSIGDCKIVAHSFTEFLQHLLEYSGGFFYWEDNPDFTSYGDAFDKL